MPFILFVPEIVVLFLHFQQIKVLLTHSLKFRSERKWLRPFFEDIFLFHAFSEIYY
jgi:hypothetical protein